jgi:flagellar basal body-associated protein FliL
MKIKQQDERVVNAIRELLSSYSEEELTDDDLDRMLDNLDNIKNGTR